MLNCTKHAVKLSTSSELQCHNGLSKGKVHPCTRTEALYRPQPIEGVDLQLYPFMITALEGGEGSASRPGRFLPPGKTRYPLYMRLGGPQGRSGQVRKISPPPGFDPRTVQPVASRYTDQLPGPLTMGKVYKIRRTEFHYKSNYNTSKPRSFSLLLLAPEEEPLDRMSHVAGYVKNRRRETRCAINNTRE